MPQQLTCSAAASELLHRRKLRSSLVEWANYIGQDKGWLPAQHHQLLLSIVQDVVNGTLRHKKTGLSCRNVIVLLPPGSAKSTYISIVFPPWFLQRKPGSRCLACSHSADLIESFSRECRNIVNANEKVLGYKLAADSKAVQEWSTTNGGTYRCSGVGAGLAGRRADLGYIDDYLGSEEDADSKLIRDKQWAWYLNDFWPRLKPDAVQIIVANRRHEDDLVGRLLAKEPDSWVVVKIPFFAKQGDLLNRPVPDRETCLGHLDFSKATVQELLEDPKVQTFLESRLWPEYFTREMAARVLLLPPRTRAGLYDQEPSPEEGDYFKSDWLQGYTRDEYQTLMAQNPRIYGAGDWAVSEERDANRVCFGGVAVDQNKIIYILPDIYWKVSGPKETCQAFLEFMRRRQPIVFWSEKGHISKAWGPFVKEMMLAEQVFGYISEVVPVRAKDIRARAIQGRMSMLQVRFPKFASWWPEAEHELLHFPSGKTDDFVDFLAHIGMGLGKITSASRVKAKPEKETLLPAPTTTLSWLKKLDLLQKASKQPIYQGR
jgi:phage terminase large subunit-like protein